MSMGYGGWCNVDCVDDGMIIYRYGSYNLNNPNNMNKERMSDGLIIIDKTGLIEPILRERVKKVNGKRVRVVKKIKREVSYSDLIDNGFIEITNSSNCWKTSIMGCDIVALQLVGQIFDYYQEKGELPEKASYNV